MSYQRNRNNKSEYYIQPEYREYRYSGFFCLITVEELKKLKEMGLREISLGIESGDDWTLDRINKGYHAEDIIEQCGKLKFSRFRSIYSTCRKIMSESGKGRGV